MLKSPLTACIIVLLKPHMIYMEFLSLNLLLPSFLILYLLPVTTICIDQPDDAGLGFWGVFLWEQDRKVNDTLSFILSGTGPGTQPAVWKLISPCLNPLLCRTLSKCFKSCASWECFHVSVPRPFILQGRVLSTRKKP